MFHRKMMRTFVLVHIISFIAIWSNQECEPCQCSEDICGPNEKYSECANAGCVRRKCSDLRRPELCIDVAAEDCIDDCVCVEGYLRNYDGDCVPINQCPERSKSNCRGLNEFYENCEAQTYTEDNKPCFVGCQCYIGYVRNRRGKCVVDRGQCTMTTQKPPTTTAPTPGEKDNALDKLWEKIADFTGQFVYGKVKQNPQESFIASPFSVFIPVGELAIGSTGKTYKQLLKFLNLKNKDEIKQTFRDVLNILAAPKNITLLLGQRVYANEQYELNPNFKSTLQKYFDADAVNLDFRRSQEAANAINNWAKEQTKGLITSVVEASMLNALTRLVLINAIYFKGDWLRPFNPKRTQKQDFYVTKDKTVQVKMMYQEGWFGYAENDDYQALRLPYKDNKFSLLTILPKSKENNALENLAEKLKDSNAIKNIMENLTNEKVQVYLPSIQTETSTDLKPVLQQANITYVFESENAELGEILKQYQQLYVSGAFQKAFITINELGSEAAAINTIIVGTTAVLNDQPKIFEANRPYVYYITSENDVLFCGAFAGV